MMTQDRSDSVGIWAWLLPAAYASHAVEEAFGGHGLMEWMAAGGGVRLSLAAFIGLNLVGAGLLCLAAWAARRSRGWRWLLISGATIIFINGIWHIAICVMARSYIPGVWTGLFLYVPLGGVFLLRLRRLVSLRLFVFAIAIGIIIHEVTLWLVLRMPGFQMVREHASLLTSR
jgi:hypothetical protein